MNIPAAIHPRLEPVRLYSILAGLVPLLLHYAPGVPWPLWLGAIAAVIGVGQGVRSKVTPYMPEPANLTAENEGDQ